MKYYRDKDGYLREKSSHKKVEDEKPCSNPFIFSGTETKFDDDYEDFQGFMQVD